MTEDLTQPPAEPAPEQSLDEMLAEALPGEESAPEQNEAQVSEETHTAEVTAADAAATETAEEAVRRAITVKLDHSEKEIDFDAMFSSDEGRAELKEMYERGYGRDRAVERARRESQEATVAWFKSRGIEVRPNPGAPGGWEVISEAVANRSTETPAQVAKPDPAEERAKLERVALYGDENDPAAQVKAIRRLTQLDAEEAAAKRFKEFEEWKNGQSRNAEQSRMRAERESAEKHARSLIRDAIVARAKSFDGPDRVRQAERAMSLAMHKATTNAKDFDEVIAVVNHYADDLDARRAHFAESLAKTPPAPTPAPSLDGTPSGAPKSDPTAGLDYSEDDHWDAAIAASRG